MEVKIWCYIHMRWLSITGITSITYTTDQCVYRFLRALDCKKVITDRNKYARNYKALSISGSSTNTHRRLC